LPELPLLPHAARTSALAEAAISIAMRFISLPGFVGGG
jgi:hypothetical protein